LPLVFLFLESGPWTQSPLNFNAKPMPERDSPFYTAPRDVFQNWGDCFVRSVAQASRLLFRWHRLSSLCFVLVLVLGVDANHPHACQFRDRKNPFSSFQGEAPPHARLPLNLSLLFSSTSWRPWRLGGCMLYFVLARGLYFSKAQ
jgi:hypothetical protein